MVLRLQWAVLVAMMMALKYNQDMIAWSSVFSRKYKRRRDEYRPNRRDEGVNVLTEVFRI